MIKAKQVMEISPTDQQALVDEALFLKGLD